MIDDLNNGSIPNKANKTILQISVGRVWLITGKYINIFIEQTSQSSSCKTEILCPLKKKNPFIFPTVYDNYRSTFCYYEFSLVTLPISYKWYHALLILCAILIFTNLIM